MTSPYKLFAVDKGLEQEGVYLTYGDFRIKIARAGGSNERYRRLIQAKLKPHRYQIDTDTLPEGVAEDVQREAYASAVVLGWETKSDTGEWEPVLETPEGKIPYSVDACVKLFKDLPDLFNDVRNAATKVSTFRKAEEEADAKN